MCSNQNIFERVHCTRILQYYIVRSVGRKSCSKFKGTKTIECSWQYFRRVSAGIRIIGHVGTYTIHLLLLLFITIITL